MDFSPGDVYTPLSEPLYAVIDLMSYQPLSDVTLTNVHN